MIRALVMSDTHGMGDDLRWVLEDAWRQTGNVPVDLYVHCGDGVGDIERMMPFILARDPGADFCIVRGNCDFGSDAILSAQLQKGGASIFVTHGHYYHVKSSLLQLDYAAQERGCSIALYGHTHVPDMTNGRALLINPGSAQDGRMAFLELEDGKPRVRLLRLST